MSTSNNMTTSSLLSNIAETGSAIGSKLINVLSKKAPTTPTNPSNPTTPTTPTNPSNTETTYLQLPLPSTSETSNQIESEQKNLSFEERVKLVQQEKEKMMNNMTKKDLVDIIFRQNNVVAQQSSQLLDIIDLANTVETTARTEERNNIKCPKYNESAIQEVYDSTVKINLLLTVIFIVILIWFFYYNNNKQEQK